jgi:hypothetical protein
MEKLPLFIHGMSITDQATASNVGVGQRLQPIRNGCHRSRMISLAPFMPAPRRLGRLRKLLARDCEHASLVYSTACQWLLLPKILYPARRSNDLFMIGGLCRR